MLQSVDVLVGLSVVMLFLSAAVTLVTQFFNDLSNQRGRFLRGGLAQLLGHLDPAHLTPPVAQTLALRILRDPTIATHWFGMRFLPMRAVGEIHREELTRLLLALGSPAAVPAQPALQAALTAGGIADPVAALAAIRTTSLDLERTEPAMSNSARQTRAILEHAGSPFVAKLNARFDPTIDRVSDRFTAVTRGVTAVAAFIVALTLQVDTIDLVNRLSMDDALRSHAVAASEKIQPPAALTQAVSNEDYETQIKATRDRIAEAAGTDLIRLPKYDLALSPHQPYVRFTHPALGLSIGMVLTALLLSLGAPFWYGTLKNLLKLRSLVATKDDADRSERQTNQATV